MKKQEQLQLEHFRQMEQLELAYYDAEFITPYEESYNWYRYRPDSIVAMEDDGRIVAFMNLLPVKKHIYEQIAAGRFNDSLMTTADIDDPKLPGESAHYYLSCVVVADAYRKSGALPIMLRHYLDVLDEVERSGTRVHSIIIDTLTAAGNRFARRLGMTLLCESDHDSHVYECSYATFKQHVLSHYPLTETRLR
ncbi:MULTISPECIES: GNAT family N-acetyltransferase [Brevibacillus]|jgi:hypothetical protein|uniref:N-acetyltransferase domain-containing protein n=1 Tax=Brevibacillus parabrevis TaxID=54914 RepID=A0A4Y3PLI8_BREPA|nr:MULTISPECIES: GNAT family N-acetyltransferase [Brevibacillus]MED2255206.1 GNAT family N-acetyltransferase [Brevibacillus parabrevis]RNB92957.1 GNAT family N-acetyltransferase [Brevibacillus parabrevis]UED70004.1 GNAT family N-acetyltransferase [Brevibacillus sp. HD3.3A]WDV96303.1 GNAT family N-acetyltransferase [Brevibacillus parabrevis]GEB32168.1 hypothetical protein BPA01_17480 [Brevibacillus parabrevis]